MNITFFPRNKIQRSLFKSCEEKLRSKGHDCSFLNPKSGVNSANEFYPEDQVSILISKQCFDRDKEFSRICKIYPNINRIIQSDRELNYFPNYFGDKAITRVDKIDFCCAFFLVFEDYLDKFKPHIIISEMVLGLMDGVLAEVARSRGVLYLGIRPSKIGPGIVFCDNEFDRPIFLRDEIKFLGSVETDVVRARASEIITENINPSDIPHYMVRSARKFQLFSVRALRAFFRVLFFSAQVSEISIYQHRRLNAFREALYKLYNIRAWKFPKQIPDSSNRSQKFFVYAAHFEPEASVQVRAFDFSDQLGLIKMLSRLMPPDVLLVVKEHRGNQGFRKPAFYRELSHLYNVEIAPPNFNLRLLARQSRGVITLTGRIGLEALVDGIPVIAFGESFWTSLNSVHKPNGTVKIKDTLQVLSNKSVQHSKDSLALLGEDLAQLIVAYQNCVFPGNFIQGSEDFLSSKNVGSYVEAILHIINRKFGVQKQ